MLSSSLNWLLNFQSTMMRSPFSSSNTASMMILSGRSRISHWRSATSSVLLYSVAMSFHPFTLGYTRVNQFLRPAVIPSMILSMDPDVHQLMKLSNFASFSFAFSMAFVIFFPIASSSLLASINACSSVRPLIVSACVLYSSTSFLKSSYQPNAIMVFDFQKSSGFWFFSRYSVFA